MSVRTLAQTAQAFVEFAPHCRPGSPLYYEFALRVAEDGELLALAAETRAGQPPANMLFGAAHDLLLRGADHPARGYYPSVGGRGEPGPAAFAAFRDLCLSLRAEIGALLQTKLTQTNETRRCSYLLPAFTTVAALGGGQPLALLEIGSSAGLNLLWDRYGYSYGDGLVYGEKNAPVQIATELRGSVHPPLPTQLPEVAWRIGVDLNPVPIDDPASVRWLEALVWPEQLERLERLRAALELARIARPKLLAGDALELLPGLLEQTPASATVCVYHTHVTYQFSEEMRTWLDALLAAAGHKRRVLRVGCESLGAEQPQLLLTRYDSAGVAERLLAETTGHANWLRWIAS
jgi:hypothetical protein